VGTLVERKTRFVVLCKMNGNGAEAVLDSFTRQMKRLPVALRKSMTYDRGSEMACHPELARRNGDYAMTGLAMIRGPDPRIVWFAMSDRPVRALAAEQALQARAAVSEVLALATDGIEVLGDLNASAQMKQH